MFRTHRNFALVLGITLSLLALACGGSGSAPPAPAEPAAAPAAPAALEPAEAAPAAAAPTPPPTAEVVIAKPDEGGVIRLQASDQMRYSATRLEAPAGKVKVELKNVGLLPKEAMGHNFVILKPGTDAMAFAMKAIAAKATDYVPAGAAEVLAHSKLLGAGESAMVEVELVAGTYPFVCTFPGHVGLMNGQLVVQ